MTPVWSRRTTGMSVGQCAADHVALCPARRRLIYCSGYSRRHVLVGTIRITALFLSFEITGRPHCMPTASLPWHIVGNAHQTPTVPTTFDGESVQLTFRLVEDFVERCLTPPGATRYTCAHGGSPRTSFTVIDAPRYSMRGYRGTRASMLLVAWGLFSGLRRTEGSSILPRRSLPAAAALVPFLHMQASSLRYLS